MILEAAASAVGKKKKLKAHIFERKRSARHSFGGPRSLDGWWDWSLTTMLEGLYWGGLSTASMPGAQEGPRALGGRHHLLGHLVIKQLKGTPDSVCEARCSLFLLISKNTLRGSRGPCVRTAYVPMCSQAWKPPGARPTLKCASDSSDWWFRPHLPSAFSELVEDSFPTCGPKDGGPETPSVIDPEIQRVAPGGPRGSQEESSAWAAQGQCDSEGQLRPHLSTLVRLPGCSRSALRAACQGQNKVVITVPAARAALTGPRASGWIDHSTRAVSMHFTLYNPPTQLFSSVSLSAEMLSTGGLTLSSLLESVTIFCSDSAPLYHILLPEVSSLGTWTTHGTQELHPGLGTLLHPGLMPYPQLDLSSGCHNEIPYSGGLKRQTLIFHSFGGWKSEMEVMAWSGAGESSLPGL
ncbi:polycystic kidney disease protein 1-like 1 [Orcinus orca]|uniref:polycystic kidney disease protein 1-like 1 n=1 Tax=Orcinus orca TaxID=9733 RepID=UPI0021131A65|nr:polycystic kidney disease protein 1-like 1 [Orcinus orca]